MESNNELMTQVVQKAWDDSSFKEQLIANPVDVVEQHFGAKLKIPTDKKLVVCDQTDNDVIYINIPGRPDEVELTEDQLETISGGVGGDENGGGCTPTFPIPIILDKLT